MKIAQIGTCKCTPFDGHDRLASLVMDGQAGHVGLPGHRALRRPEHRHRPRDLMLAAAQHHLQRLLLVQRLLRQQRSDITPGVA